MTELRQPPGRFRAAARAAMERGHTQEALAEATARLGDNRLAAWDALEDVEALRQRAHEIRMRAVDDLDGLLQQFGESLEALGGHVHFAATAEEACAAIVDICRGAGATLAAKSKSMATEEIGLNTALETAGIRAVETDLGEYILQLAGEHPVHIIAPAIEKTAAEVAELLSAVEGTPVPP